MINKNYQKARFNSSQKIKAKHLFLNDIFFGCWRNIILRLKREKKWVRLSPLSEIQPAFRQEPRPFSKRGREPTHYQTGRSYHE
jgi:hypothetical protein